MKLRNKRTGDIWEFDGGFSMKASRETAERAGGRGCGLTCYARSISELNEEWEDFKPTEPLIKDEKIRKAVRAWAEAESEDRYYGQDATTLYNGSGDHIEFWSRPFKDLTPYKHYTITELCGEEEE